MKPKEKAKELIEKFIEPTKVPNIKHIWVEDIDAAKQCALIAVNEMIKILPYGYSETRFYLDELEKEIRSYEMVS
jgi:hypothetical protein